MSIHVYFSKDPERVQHFPGESNFSSRGGGVQMLISIETHITCDFPAGSGPLIPPLDPHLNMYVVAVFLGGFNRNRKGAHIEQLFNFISYKYKV